MSIREPQFTTEHQQAAGENLDRYHVSEQVIAGVFGTETYHPSGFRIARHAHDVACFYFVLQGGLTEFCEHGRRDVGLHTVVFTPPGACHSNLFHNAGGRCFLVELPSQYNQRAINAGVLLDSWLCLKTATLTRLATSLYKEFQCIDTSSPLAVEGLVLEIMAAFSRNGANEPEAHFPVWLQRATDLLHDRFAETLTVSEIAGQTGVHPVRLAHAFRKRFRCSMGEYQRRLRVERASQELMTSTLPIGQIALAAGFADQAHFSRVFKHNTGLTPGTFRATFRLS